ncbi:MAG: sodium:proton exchanger [Candidatus Muproteobacteria bacterium RBG_16_64_11]|uniref:Sodium:proton exchanger n=1 Tax=Candidatus Muproteobacteria bacterium RBG_16_64_11 TaxID=1817758 RepID=A0A1F6TCT9_9PROT|nr:MAG: sodium:proton exchanger [Candidatus Muproteobacteria bacterium RBG_16_64_11]
MTIALLLIALLIILVGAETFTNALEHLGERLKISEGVTGSIFAAVGTALPETMVPIVAIFSASSGDIGHEVGVGAILGAPMMLATVAFFLMAVFAAPKRGWGGSFNPEHTGLQRDLGWFLLAFGVSSAAIFIPHEAPEVRAMIAFSLVLIYFIYLMQTVRASAKLVQDGHHTEADHPLYLSYIKLPENMATILLQLAIGLVLIVLGAKGFVYGIEALSAWVGLSALALSLLIIPVATELPEKVNSILWIRRHRDTLAFGNITGAMVFQGSLLPAIGVMLTPWEPRPEVLLGLALTLLAGIYLYALARRGTLRPYHFILNGLCYAAYFLIMVG